MKDTARCHDCFASVYNVTSTPVCTKRLLVQVALQQVLLTRRVWRDGTYLYSYLQTWNNCPHNSQCEAFTEICRPHINPMHHKPTGNCCYHDQLRETFPAEDARGLTQNLTASDAGESLNTRLKRGGLAAPHCRRRGAINRSNNQALLDSLPSDYFLPWLTFDNVQYGYRAWPDERQVIRIYDYCSIPVYCIQTQCRLPCSW